MKAEHANTAAMLRQLAIICYSAGQPEDGIAYGIQEIEVLKALNKTEEISYGTALYNLGLLYIANNQSTEAIPTLQESLSLHLLYFTEDEPEVAIVQGNLAIALFNTGETERSGGLFSQSIETLNSYEEKPVEYLDICYNYADWLTLEGDSAGAISLLSVIKASYEDDGYPEDLAGISLKIGRSYEQINDVNKAESLYLEAKALFEDYDLIDHPDYLICLNSLSFLYQKQGKNESALVLMQSIVEQLSPTKNETYYRALTNLAATNFNSAAYLEASRQYKEVIDYYASTEKDNVYIDASLGLSAIALKQSDYKGALNISDKAIVATEPIGLSKIKLLKSKALALRGMAKYKEAERVLLEAMNTGEKSALNNTEMTADLKLNLADLYSLMGQYTAAEELYKSCAKYYSAHQDKTTYSLYLGNYAAFLQATGNFTKADELLKETLVIKEKAFGVQSEEYLTTYENLSLLYLSTGKYELAKATLLKVEKIKRGNKNISTSSLAYTFTNLGVVHRLIGDYVTAENYLKDALDRYTLAHGQGHVLIASVQNELGLLYLKMGNIKAAQPNFEQALNTYETVHSKLHTEYASVLENLATLSHIEGNDEKSRELLTEVLKIDEATLGTSHPLYSKTLHNLASILAELEEYEESARLYNQALELENKLYGTQHPSYANTLYNVAVLEQEQNNLDQALKHFQEVVEIRRSILNSEHPDLAYSLYGLASVKQKIGDQEGARQDYKVVIEMYLKNIETYFPSLSESEKSAFYGKIRPVFQAFKDFAVSYINDNQGDAEKRAQLLAELYNLQLSTKALLLNATNKVKNRILNSGDQGLIKKFNDWKAIKEEIVKALTLSKEELSTNNIDINQLERKANQLEKELSQLSSLFAGEFDQAQLDWTQVQSSLQPQEAALELIRIKKNTKNDSVVYVGLIIKPSSSNPEMVVLPHGNDLETKMFKQYKNAIIFKVENKRSYDQFWKPFDDVLGDVKTLFLSSDGVYNKVNINTLFDPIGNEYVFDKYDLRLLSNTKELLESTNSEQLPVEAKKAAIYGFPAYELNSSAEALVTDAATERGFSGGISELPGTFTETNNIAKTLDNAFWKYEKYQRQDANETNIKNINSPKLLHIATHGFFMEDINLSADGETGLHSRAARFNPLFRSGLLMAGASNFLRGEPLPGGEDGVLTAYEAMNLNLDHTELVVMSACETGLGEVKNGEGVYGLQRSFMVAGAKNLIMSLWKVNDATTQLLMSTFYEKWIQGAGKQEAFKAAIATIKNEYKEPYYWGAFVMLGK